MRRVIEYLGIPACECCGDGVNAYTVYEDGVETEYVEIDFWIESEDQLRNYLAHLEPFNVDTGSIYY